MEGAPFPEIVPVGVGLAAQVAITLSFIVTMAHAISVRRIRGSVPMKNFIARHKRGFVVFGSGVFVSSASKTFRG